MRLRRQRQRRIAPDSPRCNTQQSCVASKARIALGEIFLTHKFVRKIIMKIKKGDAVIVRSGKDKGKEGKVLRAFPKKAMVIVEGVAVATRHKKATQRGQQGQIVHKPMPIPVSVVAIKGGKKGKGSRVGYTIEGEKKVRIIKKSGEKV